ncbi:hypothetical protein BSKO_04026 [Bryopsis sp. KO-2023]|nr:hypothetical protein BSKO_04026 [Bryopsis sp. KO-2023]
MFRFSRQLKSFARPKAGILGCHSWERIIAEDAFKSSSSSGSPGSNSGYPSAQATCGQSTATCVFPSWAEGGQSLGVVKAISDLSPGLTNPHRPSNMKFQVVEFLPDGTVSEGIKNGESLSLNPRDLSLFTMDARLTKQRATIAARDNAILFRTEVCRAIIFPHKAILFPLRRKKDTIRLAESLVSRICQESVLPFELRILEALLDATATYFDRKGRRIQFLMERIVADIDGQRRADVSDFQRLLPIRRAMTEMQYDVREARQAIAEVVDNEKVLDAICLTERQARTPDMAAGTEMGGRMHMKLAAALLDSYERQVHTVEGALKEMEENLDDAREIWHMQMDSVRNRIIQINLIMSIASFSLLLCTIPSGFFGMNLLHGLEEVTGVFPWVVGLCSGISFLSAVGLYGYYRFWPSHRHRQRVSDMKALRDILSHRIDDLNDLLSAVSFRTARVGKKEFAEIVKYNMGDPPITDEEIDLLYRAFDTNRDGFLETGEMLTSQEKTL